MAKLLAMAMKRACKESEDKADKPSKKLGIRKRAEPETEIDDLSKMTLDEKIEVFKT